MNNQVIVPIAVIVLIAIIIVISFLNGREKKELENRLRRNQSKKRLPGTGKQESQSI